jgi:hypothetical protein
MTNRQYSIRIGLDGKAEIARDFDDIEQKGEGAADNIGRAFDGAGSSVGNLTKSAKESAAVFQTFGKSGGGVTTATDFDKTLQRLKAEQDAIVSAQKQAQMQMATQSGLNASYGIGATASSAKDSAAAFEAQFADLDEIARQKAAQIGQDFQTTLNAAMGIGVPSKSAKESATVFDEQAKAMASLDERAAQLKARIDPLGTAQARLAAEIANADELLKADKITVEQHAVAVAQAQRSYDVTAKSIGKMTTEARLNSFQISNLTFQMNDVISGLAMGQKPLSILTQQGGQIYQVFAGTGMGVTGALKAVGTTLMDLLSPTVLLSGALIGVGAAAATVMYTNWQASRQLEAATEGLGKASGATAGELAAMSRQASQAGFSTVGAARDTAVAFAQTGVIGKENIVGLTKLWEQYWRVMDEDPDKAREKLTAAFKDPSKAGLELLGSVGGLSDKTAQYVRTLIAQGAYSKAQQEIQRGLSDSTKDMTDKTISLGDAWRYVKQQWAEWADGFRQKSPEEQRMMLEEEVAAAKRLGGSGAYEEDQLRKYEADHAAELSAADKKAAADRSQQESQTLSNLAGPVVRKATPGFEEQFNLSTSTELLGKLVSNKQALGMLGVSADLATEAYNRLDRATSTYLNDNQKAESATSLQIESLKHFSVASRANDAALQTRLNLSGAVLTKQEELRREQQASALVYAQASRQIAEQTIQLNMSRNAAMSAGDGYLKNAAAGMVMEARAKAAAEAFQDGVNVEMRTRQLLGEQIAQEYAAGAKQISQLGMHAEAQKKVNDALSAGTLKIGDANEQMQIEVALANLRIAKALALAQGYTKEAEALQKVIDKLPGAIANDNDEAHRNQALRTLSSQSDQIELAKKEIALQGASEKERAVELAQLRTKQQLLQQGVDINSEEGKKIIANAGEIERLNQDLQLAQASRGELESTFDSVASTWSDFITSGKYDWNSFAQAGLSALKDIESEMLKLAVINPIKNAVFGTNQPTMSSVGGIFGEILGSSGTVAAGTHHTGNMVGFSNDNRMLPANVIRFAPRAHDGLYLNPDERVIVAQTGERVLNRAETRRYNADENRPLYVTQNIQTPNPRAFQASKGQTMTSLVRSIRSAARRM